MLVSVFSYKYYDVDKEAQAKWSENILSMYHGNAVIKMYQLHQLFFDKLQRLNRMWDKAGRKASAMGRVSEGIGTLIRTALTVCSYLVLGYFVLQDRLTLGMAAYILVLSPYLFQYANDIFSVFPGIAEYKKARNTFCSWHISADNEELCEGKCSGIRIQNITVAFEEKKVISNFSYDIDFSEKYVLTGTNGSGKTSMLECLLGAEKVSQGQILYGERDISEYSVNLLHKCLVYLPQDDAMLDVTAQDLFRRRLDKESRQAMALAKKFGLTGEEISEKMIADEPTNHLDPGGRELLIQMLRRMGYWL